VGGEAKAQKAVFEADLGGPIALVIGGEEEGIRPLVQRHCDLLVSIPLQGKINSLNASVAGAILMYEIIRQRNKALT
jgi:23S rRNA (guanosine2251-2'-O)-methyltransferase